MKNAESNRSNRWQPAVRTANRKSLRRIPAKMLSVLVSVLIVLLSMPAFSSAVVLPPADGSIFVAKTANPYDTYDMTDPFDMATIQAGHRKTQVTLTVDAIPLVSQVDMVLVIDTSYSMTSAAMTAMKNASMQMALEIIEANPGSRIALARYESRAYAYDFSNDSWREYNNLSSGTTYFESDLDEINAAIDTLVIATGDEGGTNSEGGFMTADWIMQHHGRVDSAFVPSGSGTRVIVYMTDGVPTYRYTDGLAPVNDSSGSRSSATELNQGMNAGAAAMSNSNGETNIIYTVGLVGGLDPFRLSVAHLFLRDQATVTSIDWGDEEFFTTADPAKQYETGYFEALDPSTIAAIYDAITDEILTVATNGVVTDIVPSTWTLGVASFLVDGAEPGDGEVTTVANGDGTTTITWTIGAITSSATTLSYMLSGDAPNYGILDTNVSAMLEFDHILAEAPTASPVYFPVPEVMLPAFTADDEMTLAWNSAAVTFDVRDNDIAVNTKVNESESDFVPDIADMFPIFQAPVTPLGVLAQDPVTGEFTYTPDGSVLAAGYTVTFPYYLIVPETDWKSEPATVTIRVTPTATSSLEIEKVNEGGDETDEFEFTVWFNDVLYDGPAMVDGSEVDIEAGMLYLMGGQKAVISGLLLGTSYKVVETDAVGYYYSKYEDDTGTIGENGAYALFTNYADEGELTINKYVTNADGVDVTGDELVFKILISGPSFGASPVEFDITSGIPLVFDGLIYGDYTVEEVLEDGQYTSYFGWSDTVNLNGENVSDTIDIYNVEATDPDLTIVKVAENLTQGGPAVDGAVVEAVIGEVIRYTVTIANPGNMTLTDVVLTDNLVAAGSMAMVDGIATAWMAGEEAYIELDPLAPGDVVEVTYLYTITAADAVAGIRTNIATIEGVATYPMIGNGQEYLTDRKSVV